jgi:predicted unusual protein kinase regulating ubiquinone biosynthesis (AarF/ABC1/UbiB family)
MTQTLFSDNPLLRISDVRADRRRGHGAHSEYCYSTSLIQSRRRLAQFGPTSIKLGQIMAMHENMLSRCVTDELKHRSDQAPGHAFSSDPRF